MPPACAPPPVLPAHSTARHTLDLDVSRALCVARRVSAVVRYRGNVVVQEQAAKLLRTLVDISERNKAAVREEVGVVRGVTQTLLHTHTHTHTYTHTHTHTHTSPV